MADTEYKRLIQASRDAAIRGFVDIMDLALREAESMAAEQQRASAISGERAALAAIRQTLLEERGRMLQRGEALYQGYLDRAFQTMYVDLRPGMRKLSADELTLLDDEVVNYQIEIGRLAERMREASEETIGRLNVIIAGMHDAAQARERENPFRPYLLARALYETSRVTVANEGTARKLFALLSAAVLRHLPVYYESVRDVFGAVGVQGKFVMQRSHNAHHPRYYPDSGADAAVARMLPGLQRLMSELRLVQGSGTAGVAPPPTVDLQDFIRRVFRPPGALPDAGAGAAKSPLVAQLDRIQKHAVAGAGPLLRDQLALEQSPVRERMTVDVMTMLFDFIRQDESIPQPQRELLAGLQVPLLKAAVLEPDLLHKADHPARRLLNRLGSAAIDSGSTDGGLMNDAIARTVNRIRDEFDTDSQAFSRCLRDFERYVAAQPERQDLLDERAARAVDAAERFGIHLERTSEALCKALQPLDTDKRIVDFIVGRWAHVLVYAAWQEAEADGPPGLYRQCHAALPDLLWSVQDKPLPAERNTLVRMLPDLVRRLRAGMDLARMTEGEARQILDLLMHMHTRVLRAASWSDLRPQPSLEALRAGFAPTEIRWDRLSPAGLEPPRPQASVTSAVLAQCGVSADLRLGPAPSSGIAADPAPALSSWAPGKRVAFRLPDGQRQAWRLVAISTRRSLYLLREDGSDRLALYDPAALLQALQQGTMSPLEQAPVFERAVASLLNSAGRLAQAA